ncbi:MAG TPA: preprotein translocase subunit SecE [Gemmatimonadales bacterium]|nr:preprotein translocase subunit SecE [Gemmatimonadales bacterium]
MGSVQQVERRSGKMTGWFHRSTAFLVAVREELKKVTWPTQPELVKATRMIVVFSILLGLTIGLMDWLLQLILVDGVARLAR